MNTIKLFVVICLLAAGLLSVPANSQAETAEKEERSHVILTFSAPAVQHEKMRDFFRDDGKELFDKYRDEGLIADYRILINMLSNSEAIFDVSIIMDIEEGPNIQRLEEIEERLLRLVRRERFGKHITMEADVLDAYLMTSRDDIDPTSLSEDGGGVYIVAPHVIEIGNLRDYRIYSDEYLLPIMEAYIGAEALNGFTLYINSYPAGSPWQALLVFKFEDFEQMERREQVQGELRAELIAEDPVWKDWYGRRYDFRSELRTVMSSPVN